MHNLFPIVFAADAEGGGLDMFVMIGMIFLIFWFLVIRPGSKERKGRERAVKALKKHDKVVTNAGIHGTVMILEEENVVLRVDDKNNIRMRFSRAAIWQVLGDEDKLAAKGGKYDKKGDKKAAKSADADTSDADASGDETKATAESSAS
jgi:preprotein translocase subunit YajC